MHLGYDWYTFQRYLAYPWSVYYKFKEERQLYNLLVYYKDKKIRKITNQLKKKCYIPCASLVYLQMTNNISRDI